MSDVTEDFEDVERSTFDRDAARVRLQAWMQEKVGDAEVSLSALDAPSGSGMSSETLLFTATVTRGAGSEVWPLVGRLAPRPEDVPTFPRYDLDAQFRLLGLVAEHSEVPVPGARWYEPDAAVLGTPFLVMDRVEGRVPPDVPPYLFAGWLYDASDDERRRLQEATVDAIAGLHAIDLEAVDASFLSLETPGDTPLRRHLADQRAFYEWLVADGIRHPLTERAFAFLEASWPDEGAPVISWGDSRIGNVIYDGFRPVALLDWEMAAIAPRELDLGWLCFMHRFFQDIAVGVGQPGLPSMLRLSEVAATYEARTGETLGNLGWYFAYAALRHAIIMARIHRRMVHFGQAEPHDDPDDAIPHRALLERIVDDGWDPLGDD